MDLENLDRAAAIKARIDKLQEASDRLDDRSARVWIFNEKTPDESLGVWLDDAGFLKDFRRLVDEHIDALLEEAKAL